MKRRAFSLTEALVVVAVLLVLIALMLPWLGRARENSRRAVCLTNTKGMTQGLAMYVKDWNALMTLDQTALNATGNWMRDLTPYIGGEKIRQCPTASGEAARPGTAKSPWNWPDPSARVTGAYAMNGWLYNPVKLEKPESVKRPSFDLDKESASPAQFWTLPSVAAQQPNVPVFADSIWVEAMPETTDFVADLNIGSYTSCDDQMGRLAINRHDKKVDVSFLDGHSETTGIQSLWTFNWHSLWQVPNPLPVVP